MRSAGFPLLLKIIEERVPRKPYLASVLEQLQLPCSIKISLIMIKVNISSY